MSNYGSVNPELVGLALNNVQKHAREEEKAAFVAAGDPAMMGGDPAAMGGAPPMDPAMGGAPPMDPAMAGGGGAPPMDPMAQLQPMIDQAVQAAMAGQGGGGAGGGQIKPKIDVNVEIMQIKKILAKISDALGIQIPAADMVATPEDLTAMAEGGSAGAAAMDGGGGASAISPISAIDPMGAAAPEKAAWENGQAVDVGVDIVAEHQSTADKAAALWQMMATK